MRIDIFEIDIMGIDILGIDILALPHCKNVTKIIVIISKVQTCKYSHLLINY